MQTSTPAGLPVEAATVEEAVLVATLRVAKRLKQRLPGDEIDFSSLLLLKAVAQQGPLRLTALAHLLQLDASTVSRQVRGLEDRGLLERTGDPDDGRASRVVVSERGHQVVREGAERRLAFIGELLTDWGETDREALRSKLVRLTEAFVPQEQHT